MPHGAGGAQTRHVQHIVRKLRLAGALVVLALVALQAHALLHVEHAALSGEPTCLGCKAVQLGDAPPPSPAQPALPPQSSIEAPATRQVAPPELARAPCPPSRAPPGLRAGPAPATT